jgi:hypothetical protein
MDLSRDRLILELELDLKKIGREGMDWICWVQWQTNFGHVPNTGGNAGNVLITCPTISFSRTLFRGVSYKDYI